MKKVHLHLSQKKATTFWVNEHEWEEFKRNCRREFGSVDNTLRKFILHYNETKRNPSVKLDTFFGEEAKSPMKVICVHLLGATHDGKVLCRKKGKIWVQGIKCYSCEHNQLKRK